MMNKAKKCNKGFPCGKSCISRLRLCWANLSSDKQKLFETFSQFVNRIVGTSNDIESSNLVFSQNKTAFKTLEGALGMQAYFSEKYRDINKYFYDKNYKEEADDILPPHGKTLDEEELSSKQKEYRAFFSKALKKFDAKSPASLDDGKKKEFFSYIKKNWKG